MCVCVCVCMCVCKRTSICTYPYIYTCVYTHTPTHKHTHTQRRLDANAGTFDDFTLGNYPAQAYKYSDAVKQGAADAFGKVLEKVSEMIIVFPRCR